MAQPITWRNVESRNNDNVARLMDSAGQNMNAGIDSLRGALTDQQNIQTDNRANQRTYNDDQFKKALSGFNSPEELAAAEASGQFDAFTSVPNMDQDLALNGVDNRRSALQTETTDQYNYDMGVLNQKADPIAEQLSGYINSDNDDDFNKAIADPTNVSILTETGQLAQLKSDFRKRNQEQVTEGRAEEAYLNSQTDRTQMLEDNELERTQAVTDRMRKLINDTEDRANAETARTEGLAKVASSESAQTALFEAIGANNSLSAIKIDLADRLSGSDIFASHKNSVMRDAEDQFQTVYGLSSDDMLDLKNKEKEVQTTLETQRAAAKSGWEQIQANNVIRPEYANLGSGEETVESIVEKGRAQKWQTGGMSEAIYSVREEIISELKIGTEEMSGLDGALSMAVGALGEPAQGWWAWATLQNNDIGDTELKANTKTLFTEFMKEQTKKQNLITGESDYNTEVGLAGETANTNYSDFFNTTRANARNLATMSQQPTSPSN